MRRPKKSPRPVIRPVGSSAIARLRRLCRSRKNSTYCRRSRAAANSRCIAKSRPAKSRVDARLMIGSTGRGAVEKTVEPGSWIACPCPDASRNLIGCALQQSAFSTAFVRAMHCAPLIWSRRKRAAMFRASAPEDLFIILTHAIFKHCISAPCGWRCCWTS